MSVFVRPGPVCAADRRECRFDNAFHRANSLVLYSPLPVGLAGGFSRQDLPASATRWGQMGLGQYKAGVRIAPDFLQGPTAAASTQGEIGGAQQATLTAQGASRRLTFGETAMSRRLFKDAINYGLVKVHNAEYLPFGMQRNNTVMTPNGEMYFPTGIFKEDFSTQLPDRQHLFMHEMAHVWQWQMGMFVRLRGLGSWAARYKYRLSVKKRLSNYGMEQQASLLSDYYILIVYGYSIWKDLHDCKNPGPDSLSVYQSVLSDFLKNPADRSVL